MNAVNSLSTVSVRWLPPLRRALLAAALCLTSGLVRAAAPSGDAAAAVPVSDASASRSELRQAWDKWHATLADMRAMVEATPRFRDTPAHRAMAYRTLLETEAMGYNIAVAPNMNHPRPQVHTAWLPDTFSVGQQGTDSYYTLIYLDGRRTYRMTGNMGELRVMLAQVNNGLMGSPGFRMLGNYDFANFQRNANGDFEVILSADRHAGNWIALDPASRYNFVFMRRWMADWHDDPGKLRIEMQGAQETFDELSESAMAARIGAGADLIRYLTKEWTIGLYDFYIRTAGGKKNTMGLMPGEKMANDLVGSPSTYYAFGIFDLKPDEALIIESEPPQSKYWSIQLGDVWSQALDFTHHQIDVNMKRVVLDADGKFRAVIALRDPGVPNWLDPVGRGEGTIVMRNYVATTQPLPVTRKVKLSELRTYLPADTKTVTPAERQQALAWRRDGVLRLYGALTDR